MELLKGSQGRQNGLVLIDENEEFRFALLSLTQLLDVGCLQLSEESVQLGPDILNGLFQFEVWCNPNNLVSFPDDVEMFCCRPAICEDFSVSEQVKAFRRGPKNLNVEVLLRGQGFSLGAQVPKRLKLIFRRRSQLL